MSNLPVAHVLREEILSTARANWISDLMPWVHPPARGAVNCLAAAGQTVGVCSHRILNDTPSILTSDHTRVMPSPDDRRPCSHAPRQSANGNIVRSPVMLPHAALSRAHTDELSTRSMRPKEDAPQRPPLGRTTSFVYPARSLLVNANKCEGLGSPPTPTRPLLDANGVSMDPAIVVQRAHVNHRAARKL